MPKLTQDQIRTAVSTRFAAAYADHAQLQKVRDTALDYYYGKQPFPPDDPGRSQIVSKDMMDTIEWMMPSLMRVFMSQNAIKFDPVGPEDEKSAEQESEYTNHVLWKQNDGFMILYQWIKDALMQKVGYVQYGWEETEKVCFEEYTGLTQDQLVMVLTELESYGEVEIVGAEASHTAPGQPQYWDIKAKVTYTRGRVKIDPVPGEEVVVSGDCRGSVKNAKFAGRIRTLTRSELLEMGFSRAQVEELTDFTWDESTARASRDAQSRTETEDDGVDWATTEVTVLDCYTSLDEDDDGYSELRHFIMGGNDILTDDEVDEIQLDSWTPIPMPHKHAGLDVYDLIEDLQRIQTALKRGLLDSTYYTMNPRLLYDKTTVNVAMLRVNRPGAHVANDGPVSAGSLMPIVQPDFGPKLLPVIQAFDDVRTRRTGVGDMTTGTDADVLAQATKGAFMNAMTAASQRIEAIARIFGETGLASLFKSLHKLLCKHQDWPTRFKLRGDWVEVNPTEWEERANLTVAVGLGTAGKEEIRANLGMMGTVMQQLAAQPGLIQAKNAYAFGMRMQKELGFEGEPFITDPNSPEYKQFMQQASKQPPDPYLEGEKIKSQTKLQEKQIESRDKAQDRMANRDKWITELEVKTAMDIAKPGIGAEVAVGGRAGQPRPQGPGASVQ